MGGWVFEKVGFPFSIFNNWKESIVNIYNINKMAEWYWIVKQGGDNTDGGQPMPGDW